MSKVEENSPLAFTQELLRVQQRLNSLTGELHSAVVAWQTASESDAFEAALALWAAWSADTSSEDASQLSPFLALPPPYAGDCIRAVLRPHCIHLIRGGASTGNVVLHGAVGVGKTTMLKVCAMLHAMRHLRATVVFWDYEATKASDLSGSPVQYFPPDPHHILRQVMHWARGDRSAELLPPTVDNVWAPFGFGMLSDARAMCGVYCDEINYLYRPASRYDPTKDEPPATATVAWGQTCVTRLFNLGKDTNCLVMCSGSASVLRAMVFPPSQGPWRRYQGLNHSVYRIKTVLPLRSGEQVMKYVRQRYPHIDIDDDTAQRLFRATGGVVRRIANWARTGDDLDVTAETARHVPVRTCLPRRRRACVPHGCPRHTTQSRR